MALSLWLHYCFMLPGPQGHGNWRNAKELIGFALGRNQVEEKKRFEIGRDACHSGLSDAELVQRYILREYQMGKTNAQMADHIVWMMNAHQDVYAWLQWEIAIALGARFQALQDRISVLWPSDRAGATFNTYDVAAAAVRLGFGGAGPAPVVVAYHWHIARAMLVTEKLIHRSTCSLPISVRQLDRRSVQWWTRSIPGWVIYEPLARGECLRRRYV